MGDRAVSAPQQIAEKAVVIHIDIDPAEIGKNMPVDIPIVGDIRTVMRALAEQVKNTVPQEWLDQTLGYKRHTPAAANRVLTAWSRACSSVTSPR